MLKNHLYAPSGWILASKVTPASVLILCLLIFISCGAQAADVSQEADSVPHGFTMRSPDFNDGGSLSKHNESASSARGCHGDNVAPTLQWTGVPAGAKSFALTMYDVDANHIHWIVFNIPGNQSELRDHPPYDQGVNTALQVGYNGPCPTPDGQIHHYVFTLYALSVASIQGDQTMTYQLLLSKITPNTQKITSIIGTFSRTSDT